MFSFEKRLLEWIESRRFFLFASVVTFMAIMARVPCLQYESRDFILFMEPWYMAFKEEGFAALSRQVGDYNIPFQFLTILLTFIPVDGLYAYKMISILFDFLLALTAAQFAFVLSGRKNRVIMVATYSAVILCPTVILNSSSWGQINSIYSFFAVLSLLFLYEKKDVRAFVFLGFAVAIKLQAVLFLPVFIYIYFTEKRFSLFHFLIPIGSMYALCLPGFICGRGLLAPLEVCYENTKLFPEMTLNMPNLWWLFGGDRAYYSILGISITMVVLGAALIFFIGKDGLFRDPILFISLCAWTYWTAVMLLPGMHERYMFPGEILLIILAVINRRYIVIAIPALVITLMTYGTYLCEYPYVPREIALLYLLVWLVFSAVCYRNIVKRNSCREKEEQ